MYFLFSGEGPTDLGSGDTDAEVCAAEYYRYGPMTILVDLIVEVRHNYSLLESKHYGFVSEKALKGRAKNLRPIAMPGKGRRQETAYFYKNARALAAIATEQAKVLDGEVVAILFRDADGTASAGRGEWHDKYQSMLHGFKAERFHRGVPMVPKPKSEAWLICLLKPEPGKGCPALEDRSGNDNSPNSLKAELNGMLNITVTRDSLNSILQDRHELLKLLFSEKKHRDEHLPQLGMPSFDAFRYRLDEVL